MTTNFSTPLTPTAGLAAQNKPSEVENAAVRDERSTSKFVVEFTANEFCFLVNTIELRIIYEESLTNVYELRAYNTNCNPINS